LRHSTLLYCSAHHPSPLSFPTRRSSDLLRERTQNIDELSRSDCQFLGLTRPFDGHIRRNLDLDIGSDKLDVGVRPGKQHVGQDRDRKSTRLNASHDQISYAVFCLTKKIY